MISIRKYLDDVVPHEAERPVARGTCGGGADDRPWAEAYRGALQAFGRAGADACPAIAADFSAAIAGLCEQAGAKGATATLSLMDQRVRVEVAGWGRKAAAHFRQKTVEVKHMLLAMAHTAESVSQRDQRCASQMESLTSQLRDIAGLDDLTQIRQSIEQSAQDIKGSIDRVTAEGKAVLDGMQATISEFQTRLEEAEQAASVDALTRLRTRMWMEAQLEERVEAAATFSVALLDIDRFKAVNDRHGHLAGDELLRLFAAELRASCRASDLVGRWGGDEFLIVFDGSPEQAQAQVERVRAWVCGNYDLQGRHTRIAVEASIGTAVFTAGETLEQLLERADQAMYARKTPRRP